MKSHARCAALVIVPLASAVGAHATQVTLSLPSSGFSCSLLPNGGSGGDCSSGAGVTPNSGGISFFTSSGGFAFSSGGSIQMLTSGSGSGAIGVGALVPYGYAFSLDDEQIDPQWTLEFGILDATTETVILDQIVSGSFGVGTTLFSGSGTFTTLAGTSAGDILNAGFVLSENSADFVDIAIPEGSSVDFGAISNNASTAPEPGSIGLLGGGLAWLAFQLRKRRKS